MHITAVRTPAVLAPGGGPDSRAFVLALALVCLLGFPGELAAADPPGRSILVLEQSDVRGPFYSAIFAAIRAKVNEAASPTTLYVENLDLSRFQGADYEQALQALFRVKYRDKPIGVVVAVGSAALNYALRWRADLWADAPVVFAFVDESVAARIQLPADVTGRTTRLWLQDMVSAARAVVPDLTRVAVVGDRLETQTVFTHFEDALPAIASQLQVIDLTGLPMVELRKRVAALPDRSAILYTAIYSDGAGTYFPPSTALEMVSAVANRPIIAPVETYIGRGAIGGYVAIPSVIGDEAAELALQILDGKAAASIPVAAGTSLKPVFDWPMMQRWGVDEASLPDGAEIRNRPFSLWEQYPRQAAAAIAVVLLQSTLIGALLYERRRRREAEVEVRTRMNEVAHMSRFATAGELSAQIAHEVNQPLGAILNNAEAADLLLDSPVPDIAEIKEILADIKRDDLRASGVVVRLRRLLRKAPVDTQDVDLNEVVHEVFDFASAQALARGVTLKKQLEEAPLSVRGDPIQLQQVVLNLVSNAIDATSQRPAGHRRITAETTRLNDTNAEISIADTGPGIRAAELARIFDPFVTTKDKGMGMGLSIARTIVGAHGGTIRAENQPDGGAIFRVELPLKPSGAERLP
jgi:signal transduction histidine kinase